MKKIMIVMVMFLGVMSAYGENITKLEKWAECKEASVYGESVTFGDGILFVDAIADNAFRIRYMEQQKYDLPEWVYVTDSHVRMKKKMIGPAVIFSTSAGVSVEVDTYHKTVSGKDKSGNVVFRATEHSLRASKVQDQECYEATLRCNSRSDEHLYGLGQFQDGYTNIRGLSRRLTQVNTQISIPMVLSDKGYGLLWNNYGLTEFNPPKESVSLVRESGEGQSERVNVTSTTGGREETRMSNRFSADIEVESDGMYSILLDVGQSMARRHNLAVDGQPVIDIRNVWLPPTVSTRIRLTKGKHHVTAELERNDKPTLYFSKIEDQTVWRSPVANCVDYTLFLGTADEVVGAYRQLSGGTPLMPKWALGYIHCRERFHSQDELVQTARRFRDEGIPIDMIVQDWQYWGKYGWNAMRFDEDHYPDPGKMVSDLHDMEVRLMVSVWSKIDKNSEVGKQMLSSGYYIDGSDWIDFFNNDAATAYWDNFSKRLLPYKIDAWWQDATEPENDDLAGRRVGGGKYAGELFRNIYPLLVNKTVFEGCRKDASDRRSMILTRCGFPGIQRYGAAMWSGDVGNDFPTLRRQIQSGLGMQSAGIPWWTYDAGGFFRPGDQYTDQGYIERMLRWIEASVYLPLMRVHGYMSNTEPWNYGPEAQRVITECIRERYRLMPYIYSNAAEVTMKGSTMMRPLVFDFASDSKALDEECEYMFGKSLLVNPVTEKGVETWSTYLPKTKGGWYDFRTGRHYEGGETVSTAVDIATIPVFAKAGSIVVTGRDIQSTSESQSGELTIHVYPGADAIFDLYDDEGINYNYENGKYSLVRITWDDAKKQLTIGKRKGSFDGMVNHQTFVVVMPDGKSQTVEYNGIAAIKIGIKKFS